MKPPSLAAGIDRLHRLAWQPGASMHACWWRQLALEHWEDVYRRTPSCRRAIDAAIVARRRFPSTPLRTTLPQREALLIDLAPDWARFITALGIVALDCPDHLLLSVHRQSLAQSLSMQDCEQMLAIHSGWSMNAAPLAADRLAQAAYEAGARWWARDAGTNSTYQLLSTLLPPVEPADNAPAASAMDWMSRLARFL